MLFWKRKSKQSQSQPESLCAKKEESPIVKYKFLMEHDGFRIDYVEITLNKPIKPAKPGIKILPPEKFE